MPVRLAVLAGLSAGAALVALPAAGAGATVDVHVGDFNPKLSAVFTAYYPQRIVVRQGDNVRFHFGGFDSATFVPRGQRLPPLITPTGDDAPATDDAAGVPYWWVGQPLLGLNGQIFGPTPGTAVTGRTLVHSGLPMGPRHVFTATFPRIGAFAVRSVVHPGMRATVVVLPRRAATPAARQVARQVARQKAQHLRQARALAKRTAPAGTVLVGPGNPNVALFRFAPANSTVKAGARVTFRMAGRNENHTVTFGPTAKLMQLAQGFEGPSLSAEAVYPSDAPGVVPAVTATSHGDGFANSGVMADPGMPGPLPKRFTVTFPEAGSYDYLCLIHPDMKGTITVAP